MSKTEDIAYALKELNAAYAAGRISEVDYIAQDGRLRARQAKMVLAGGQRTTARDARWRPRIAVSGHP